MSAKVVLKRVVDGGDDDAIVELMEQVTDKLDKLPKEAKDKFVRVTIELVDLKDD